MSRVVGSSAALAVAAAPALSLQFGRARSTCHVCRQGIPALRRRARAMAVAVPTESIDSTLASQVGDAAQLELDIHTYRILNLKGIK